MGEKFGGATTESAMRGQAPATGAPFMHNEAGEAPRDEAPPAVDIPKHKGNQHMLIGPLRHQPFDKTEGVDVNKRHFLPQTSGNPSSAAQDLKIVGDTAIIPESKHGDGGQKLSELLPPPRTDPDAEPSEATFPAFQGFDKINPTPPAAPIDRQIEHRGPLNEPRVTGVVSTGEPPIRVVGSESPEAKAIESGASDGKLASAESSQPPQFVPPDTYPLTGTQAQLRTDGPTPKEWEARGYPKDAYPPDGFAKKDDDGNIVS